MCCHTYRAVVSLSSSHNVRFHSQRLWQAAAKLRTIPVGGGCWSFLEFVGVKWRLLEVVGGCWGLLVADRGCWRLLQRVLYDISDRILLAFPLRMFTASVNSVPGGRHPVLSMLTATSAQHPL